MDATRCGPDCRGAVIPGRERCLRHLDEEGRRIYLAELRPGADFDLSGTEIDARLLRTLLDALRDDNGVVRMGRTRWTDAVFPERADFHGVVFEGEAVLSRAEFRAVACFSGAVFREDVTFHGAVCRAELSFSLATFERARKLGPLRVGGPLTLRGTRFAAPVVIEAVAESVDCTEARFEEPATLAARYAVVTLDRAVLLHPCTVTTLTGEEYTRDGDPTVAVRSLRGVDAAQLLLADVDLSDCAFAGAHHLDQLRLEGLWRLRQAPAGVRWSRGLPRWCARRQVLREERDWRANPRRPRASRHDWGPPPADPAAVPGLATLTSTYRQLRKAREDAKDEPGAADFYYGEMEMRRYSKDWRYAERWLLQAYWALSGYGLRASRALGWLLAAVLAAVLLMTAVGLPDTAARAYGPHARVAGERPPTLRAPLAERFNTPRAAEATAVVLDSVVFRTSDRPLTRVGGYLEKGARITGPLLLGLAVLAVRGRIKRG